MRISSSSQTKTGKNLMPQSNIFIKCFVISRHPPKEKTKQLRLIRVQRDEPIQTGKKKKTYGPARHHRKEAPPRLQSLSVEGSVPAGGM
jgi:hypothetical protein